MIRASAAALVGALGLGVPAAMAVGGGAFAASGAAAPLPPGSPGLTGQFQLSGVITAAKHVRGEHRGQRVQRAWTFTPQCSVGPCSTVTLVRRRRVGTDTTVLTATSPTTYTGQGLFYAPLRCAGRMRAHGEAVPFTITVTVTATTTVAGAPIASQIHATYVNRRRRNLTRCIDVTGHDAAAYDGQLVGPAAT